MEPLDPARIRAIDEQMQCHLDYCWAVSDPEVRARYGGRVVVASLRSVWGSGADGFAALADARSRPGFPEDSDYIFVTVPAGDTDSLDSYFPDTAQTPAAGPAA